MRFASRCGRGDANTGSSLIMTAGTPASSTRVALTSRSDGSPTSAVSLPPVFVVANVVAVIDCDVEPEGPIPGTATAPGLEALRLLCCEGGGDCLTPTSLVCGVESSWGFSELYAGRVAASFVSISFAFFISGDSSNDTANTADAAKACVAVASFLSAASAN